MGGKFAIGLALLCLINVTEVFAANSDTVSADNKDNVKLTFGLNVWSANWAQLPYMYYKDKGILIELNEWSGNKGKIRSQSLLMGPSLNIRSGNLFFETTYLASTSDFTFPVTEIDDGTGNINTLSTNVAWKDIDAVVGYAVHSGDASGDIFIGYKKISAKITSHLADANGSTLAWNTAVDMTGPEFGIRGNHKPLWKTLRWYDKWTFSWLKYEVSDASGQFYTPKKHLSITGEIGSVYNISDNFVANIGIKAQGIFGSYSQGADEYEGPWDLVTGITAGLNYSF